MNKAIAAILSDEDPIVFFEGFTIRNVPWCPAEDWIEAIECGNGIVLRYGAAKDGKTRCSRVAFSQEGVENLKALVADQERQQQKPDHKLHLQWSDELLGDVAVALCSSTRWVNGFGAKSVLDALTPVIEKVVEGKLREFAGAAFHNPEIGQALVDDFIRASAERAE